jgi:hypothetical protein
MWTSILEAINALGIALPPLVIYQGVTIQHQWLLEDLEGLEDWHFITHSRVFLLEDIVIARELPI